MTAFGHKLYMDRCIDKLTAYLADARASGDADTAFYKAVKRTYHPVEELPSIPYVCLKVPTGGGKTVMGCRAVGAAAHAYLSQERCVVLWLVPTETIRSQTYNALRDPNHPYRTVIEAELHGTITVLDLREALAVPRATLDGDTVIVVSTLAALRVEDTDGRKIYEQNGALMSHLDEYPPALLEGLETYDDGKPIPSLANVLALRRPVVIMDEAHNARTDLSFSALARFRPSCIVEFTATPVTSRKGHPSNVLIEVPAKDLKEEGMIKLPIHLQVAPDWKQSLLNAINKRAELQAFADAEHASGGHYLRPIVLVQAQPKNMDLPIEEVRAALSDLGVPDHEIAVETGTQHDLADHDLFSPACPVKYVITIDRLREGWDCSFAYILCSLRDLSSATAVEQILGRVLRMPQGEPKARPELNHAYAFVTKRFAARAPHEVLADALVGNGFTHEEAAEAFASPALPGLGGLFGSPLSRPDAPSLKGATLTVPQLALWTGSEWEPITEDHLLQADWNLATCDASLPAFELDTAIEEFVLDIGKTGKAWVAREPAAPLPPQLQLAALRLGEFRTKGEAAVWLDRHIEHPDISQSAAQAFLIQVVERLTAERQIPLPSLSRQRLRLRDAAAARIDEHRKAALAKAHQTLLFDSPTDRVAVRSEASFAYPPQYGAPRPYSGPFVFDRHFYPEINDLNHEEEACARLIDSLNGTEHWVRNIERRDDSFRLLLPDNHWFYPDFLVRLKDGRTLVVEYKGEHLESAADAQTKARMGELYEARSAGACLFRMVGKDDFPAALTSLPACPAA